MNLCIYIYVFSDLGGVEEHLIMHLHLPQQPVDLSVGESHENHVVDPKQRHKN